MPADLNHTEINKTHGGRRTGAGRKPSRSLRSDRSETPTPSLASVASEPPAITLAAAWQRATADERRAFVREHRSWFGFYGG